MTAKKTEGDSEPLPQIPTIAIYQQPDHVAGLLQQIYGQPLVMGETREHSGEQEGTAKGSGSADATVGGKGKVPALGEIEARVAANFGRGSDSRSLAAQRTVSEFVYSQAYYLYLVRGGLRSQNLVKVVKSEDDISTLQSGDFVEFEAAFKADQIAAALDILQPSLVAQVTNQIRMHKWSKATDWDSFEDMQIKLATFKEALAADVTLAAAIADAVRVDFRSDKTREFYGHIGSEDSEAVAITICDTEHFTVSDEDRILDGRFTVLGKVSEGPARDRPILERNKLLDKLNPETVDKLFIDMNAAVQKRGEAVEKNIPANPGEEEEEAIKSPLNLSLDSRVYGTSFKVVPIAIFT